MTQDDQSSQDQLFRSPSAEYRSLPFWAWNAVLEPKEVARQIRAMKEQGMGGFFMHSRDGLETPYMGPEWMNAVRTAIATAKEEGMAAWLYDEDRWPSGSSGGKVPALGDAFRAKGLTLEICADGYTPAQDVIALFRAQTCELELRHGERLDPASEHRSVPGTVLLIFRIEIPAGDEWFNGETPPDNMNPDTVDAFIDRNYRPYFEAFGQHFGTTVPGVFTDEPSVHDRHCQFTPGRGWIPWTYHFAAFFESRRGYDPLNLIPQVFFDGPDMARIRHDYWRTVTELFCESYTQRLGTWCNEHALNFTGHFLWENQLGTATRTGGAIMPHYRFQQVPGVDLLCEQIDETITIKQCTSVANQYGRSRVISEMYGCTGWEFSFEGQKWLGDWQFVMGVNVRSQHLAQYSLRGCRKRDYPPAFSDNTTWWQQHRVVEDYFARLSVALTRGKPIRHLLILHPSTTAWSRLGSNPRGFEDRGQDRNLPDVNAFGAEFNRLLRAILGAHHDFDLGDELIMAETGTVDGTRLRINQASYQAVLIPAIDTMLRSTLQLLMAFLDAGGKVISIRPHPTRIEGILSPEILALYQHGNAISVDSPAAALRALESVLPPTVRLMNPYEAEDPDILCMHRSAEDGTETLFVVNTDRDQRHALRIEVPGTVLIEEMLPLSGQIRPLAVHHAPGRTTFLADMGRAGSRLYRITSGAAGTGCLGASSLPPVFPPPSNPLANPPILHGLGPTARYRRTGPNALVLDQCAFKLDQGDWSEVVEVWQAQRAIRSTLGMRQVYGNGLTQRYLWAAEPHPGDGTPVRFRFTFEVTDIPEQDIFLILENADAYRITLNGTDAASADGWFLDASFQKIRLPRPQMGRNTLELSCTYLNGMEVEDCFIIGDFAVDSKRALTREPGRLHFGDWCLQGFPHYCGSMVYEFEFESTATPAVLRLGEFSATTVEVRVNGQFAGHIPWHDADGLDLGDMLRNGSNLLEIEVVGSPRNLLGPFHLARGKVAFNEWTAFRPEGKDYTPDYVLHPYGLFSQVILGERSLG